MADDCEAHSIERCRLALKARIEQQVTLEESRIRLGEREFTWYRVTDPGRLLDAAVRNSDQPAEELDPFWAATWRAAQGLDQFLARLSLQGQRVLELGCGSGQAGTGAAARGAQVTMTDAVGIALMVARLNAWPLGKRVEFRRLQWACDRLDVASFPIIIGSDLVYDPKLFSLIELCARHHLSPEGRLYLSEPQRHTGDHFARWIRQAGWASKEHEIDLQDDRVAIRVFECWLAEA